jgi:thiol-disulfide isomerase/thioredoxin
MDARVIGPYSLLTCSNGLSRGLQTRRRPSVVRCRTPVARPAERESSDCDAKKALIAAITTCSLLIQQPTASAQVSLTIAPTATPPTQQNTQNTSSPLAAYEAPPLSGDDVERWWEQDSDSWLELRSEDEVHKFLTATSSSFNARLKLVEFYATWCPACRAASPGLAAVAQDPVLNQTCTFARYGIGC